VALEEFDVGEPEAGQREAAQDSEGIEAVQGGDGNEGEGGRRTGHSPMVARIDGTTKKPPGLRAGGFVKKTRSIT